MLWAMIACIVFPVIGGMVASRKETPEDQRIFQRATEMQ